MTAIPPQLHYCWFGPQPEPHGDLRAGWRRYHPGAEIVRWNEQNAPIGHPYLATALRAGAWSKASDFMRLWLMVEHGGVYLDVDVECLRPLTPLFDRGLFVGFQRERTFDPYEWVNTAVLGATRGHPVARELLGRLLARDDGTLAPMESGPRLMSRFLQEQGLAHSDEEVRLGAGESAMSVLPREAFYPYSWEEAADRSRITDRTYAVHHWDGSWVAEWLARRPSRSEGVVGRDR